MQYKKTVISFVVLLFLSVEGASCFSDQPMSKQEWSKAIKAMNAECNVCEKALNEALLEGDFDGASEALSALQEMMDPLLARRPSQSIQKIAAEERFESLTQQYQAAVQQKAYALEEGIWEMLKRGRLQEADDALNALHALMFNHDAWAPQFAKLDTEYKQKKDVADTKSARACAADDASWRGMDQFNNPEGAFRGVNFSLLRGVRSLVTVAQRVFNPPPAYPTQVTDGVRALNASVYNKVRGAEVKRWFRERVIEGDEYDPIEALEDRTRRATQPTQEEIDDAAGRKWVDEKYDYEPTLAVKKFVVISNGWEYSREAEALLARTASYPAWLTVHAVLEERLRTKRVALGGEEPQHSTDPQFFRMTRPAKNGYANPEEFKQVCKARQEALVALRDATRDAKPTGRDDLVEECRAFGKKHGLETGDSMAQRWTSALW